MKKQSNDANYCRCRKCQEYFVFLPDETRWLEFDTYSEKITNCPYCGCINTIKYQDGFNQNPNLDERYFK